MEEKVDLKEKLFKLLFVNIVIFITFFIIFGMFVFSMIKNNVYNSVDKELYDTRNQILELDSFIKEFDFLEYGEDFLFLKKAVENYRTQIPNRQNINPNVMILVRDRNGTIVESQIGRLIDFQDEIDFNSKSLNKIYNEDINKEYYYRGINFELEADLENDGKYVQLLINVDTERRLVEGYLRIIAYSVVIICGLSMIASFILTRKTLEPIRENIVKQMEFVQNVSHELRTPLTIIQAKQELLLQEPESKIIDKSEDIVLTLNETKRLSRLVKDLLVLSRADTNKMMLQKEKVNIDDYIKEIVAPYSEVAEIEEKNIKLELNYNSEINIDVNKIYQVMIILLDNAIKYTEKDDEILINTYLKDNKCVIEVKDTGIGISDDGIKRIFERFYREDQARNRETGGTGLGLSIAETIVNAHNGTIKASHNNPKGTIFTIRLPK